jgi:methylated-DNA-[protein]-cysteine S-methyltransferase
MNAAPSFVSYYESPIGWLELRADANALTSARFVPERSTQRSTALLTEAQRQLSAYFAGKRQYFDLPLRLEGTPFQQQVWQRLRDIEFARTRSYLQLARELADEKSVRAVAAANSKNQLALLVPCHRVIGTDGKPVGYAWELWRKRWLLQHEQRHAGTGQLWLF